MNINITTRNTNPIVNPMLSIYTAVSQFGLLPCPAQLPFLGVDGL